MERDSILSHGLSSFSRESLFVTSDYYTINVCEKCGNIISLPTECRICRKSDIACVDMPYATKLLTQQLQSMGIGIKIEVK
jgi:DNA-directed RNA polymerase beta subunit